MGYPQKTVEPYPFERYSPSAGSRQGYRSNQNE
ncbi:hypothetical protein FOQG_19319 [Fusarium oxysporum f. sp. raphani 54005]|uniref:Uncharacterized protein n=1 Tax=Fusarium oxysporum f. sp. raphani 54005 TaxID=1089458 RepID=X0B1C5_FUSOX|nr:hypothetical protein FOQG_19319 [Fusarium oxysporum f. sp. raphani 54005]